VVPSEIAARHSSISLNTRPIDPLGSRYAWYLQLLWWLGPLLLALIAITLALVLGGAAVTGQTIPRSPARLPRPGHQPAR